MSQDDVLRLLIAEPSLNDAEMYISVLRNAGHAVRAQRIEDGDELREVLEEKPFDLLLCHAGIQDLSPTLALESIQRSGRDIPVLALADAHEDELRRSLMTQGTADLVAKNDLQHLRLVVEREFRQVRERRRLRQLERALKETERRCSALLDSSRDAIAYVHEGMHLYANPAYLEKFGVEEFEDIEGMPLLDMIAPDHQGEFKNCLRKLSKGDYDVPEMELEIVTDAGPLPVLASFSPASIDGEPCTQILLREQSSDRELEQQLETLSKQDLVTGLFNRVHFQELLSDALAERRPAEDDPPHGLLYIQVDRPPGGSHQPGLTLADQVMSDLANLVRGELGTDGIAGRFADDVVTVFLPYCGVHETVATAEAVRQSLEEHIVQAGERTTTVTCSIGAVMLGERSGDMHQALADAALACETAQSGGGNRVHLHSAGAGAGDPEENAAWKDRLEDALADNRFFLMYMPVVSLQGEGGERYEARIRLRDNGDKHPSEFIPAAESLGMMDRIDRWVVNAALEMLQHRGDNAEIQLHLKLSPQTVTDAGFLEFLAGALKSSGTPGERLVFQVNESMAQTSLNEARQLFRGLKELGCGFCLDHFGTGLNSFQLLKHLPADLLKLDKTLIREMIDTEDGAERVKAIVDHAHTLRKAVVAGHVEDPMCLAQLWQQQVDFVQGTFLQSPSETPDYDFSGTVM
ncbi:MAG: EAL domain-containing protein [Ectothiorhodospiraceae bacterium]|nr:EAL domain-containing protein [Ectothiorhodospiraceae bacterium]